MPTVGIVPFFSQQDKATGRILLRSCGETKASVYVAARLAEAGWRVRLLLPRRVRCADWPAVHPAVEIVEADVPADNQRQRVWFDPAAWDALFADADLAFVFHECLGWPLKHIYPRLRVVQFTTVPAGEAWPWTTPLLRASWAAVDVNAVYSDPMARHVAAQLALTGVSRESPTVWPFAFDAANFPDDQVPARDVDVLFVPRGSSTSSMR